MQLRSWKLLRKSKVCACGESYIGGHHQRVCPKCMPEHIAKRRKIAMQLYDRGVRRQKLRRGGLV